MKNGMVKKHKTNSKARRSGVILERIERKIDLLSEGQVGMKEKLDATFEMVGELSENMTTVKDDISIMRGDIKSIKDELKKKVDINDFAVLHKKTR